MPACTEDTVVTGDELLTPAEAAAITKLTVSTLKDKRWRGTGPAFIKLSPGRGGRIRYPRSSIERWLNGRGAEIAG